MISKKLRKKLRKKKFNINLFETNIYLITNKDLFQDIYDDIDYSASAYNASGLCLSTSDKGIKDIYIGIFCSRDDVLVHECVHASLFILNHIDETANCDSELQPYLVQTLFRECKKIKEGF